MTRVRAVDSFSGDWLFGKGQNDYVQAGAAVLQDINTRLNAFIGDCFFDLGAGIDWFNLLGAKDQTALNLAIASVILNTPNVTGVVQLAVALDAKRNLSVTYQVSTIYSNSSGTFSLTLGVKELDIALEQGGLLAQEDGSLLSFDY